MIALLATPSSPSVPQMAACAVLAAVVIAWSIHLARRKGRWLAAMGPIAAAALFAALAEWPGGGADPPAPVHPQPARDPIPSSGFAQQRGPAPPANRSPEIVPPAAPEPAPQGPPPQVVVAGTWTEEDRVVVQSALLTALVPVPQARGTRLRVEAVGRALPPTSPGAPRYGIAGTWTLHAEPGGQVLASDALPDVQGWGATADQARGHAAERAGRRVAASIRNSSPAAP
jgi:hypothetical protein